ncbi:hypothetical protein J3D55_002296 [Chryseobacterium ginsenosidimutans]|nr:hypothetical protein [Chryseobacterium ginsenosidimutans]
MYITVPGIESVIGMTVIAARFQNGLNCYRYFIIISDSIDRSALADIFLTPIN